MEAYTTHNAFKSVGIPRPGQEVCPHLNNLCCLGEGPFCFGDGVFVGVSIIIMRFFFLMHPLFVNRQGIEKTTLMTINYYNPKTMHIVVLEGV
jgi:hypothetical protein